MLDAVFLIPAFPLVGFAAILVFGRRLGEPAAGWLATAAMGGSFAAAVVTFVGLVAEEAEERRFVQTLWEWVPAGDLSVDVGFLVDPLSITMTLFITGVGALIHLYSIGYMHGDRDYSKFFLYLNLFAFSMLMLVLGDNLLLTFLGWEGVGACSYFLISFWFTEDANASAGKKAAQSIKVAAADQVCCTKNAEYFFADRQRCRRIGATIVRDRHCRNGNDGRQVCCEFGRRRDDIMSRRECRRHRGCEW